MTFNLLLALTAVVGLLWPASGSALAPARTWLIVAVMFLMALTLPGERLRRAAGNVRGLASCALLSYVLLPLLCLGVARVLFDDEPGMVAGLAILGALPCTLASAAVWTRLARGDDALSLVYTVASNVAGVVVIPVLLALCLGRALAVPADSIVVDLVGVVLLPVAAGQVVRRLLGARVDRWKQTVSVVARALVLGVVLVAVSKMSARIFDQPGMTLSMIGTALVLHLVALAAADRTARLVRLPDDERTAVLFAGTQKTLFVGVFLAAEYFPGDPFALLPITAYHAVQLLVDTIVASRLAARAG